MVEKINAGEDAMEESVKDAINVLLELKKSGMLGMLKYLAEHSNDVFLSVATDPSIMRGVAVLAALLAGLERVDAGTLSNAQVNLEKLTSCAVSALGSVDLKKSRKIGLMGLLSALNDPDVSYGLALLIEIAKGLGSCARKNENHK